MVLNEVRAKYVLGLTATPERQDGHQKIIFMAAGPIRYKVKQSHDEQFTQTVMIHQLYDVSSAELITTDERPKISDAYRWLVDNQQRTSKIVSDAYECVQNGGHPLVLTERREHAEYIHSRLTEMGISTVVLKGAMKAAERKNADNHLQSAQVVVATGKYVGEGFDLPRLDTLFLAMPIAWKGTLAQYAGRIHRESEGKTQVTIHDYVDCALPMLQRMFKNARKATRQWGTPLNTLRVTVTSNLHSSWKTPLQQIPSQNKQQHLIKHFPMPLPPYAKTTIRLAFGSRSQTGKLAHLLFGVSIEIQRG
ncbi:hypothetical protein QYZ46_15240 [Vibrio parahaemolyticus]|nr:hypothetical protein [Vibrio parahaemolyticus]